MTSEQPAPTTPNIWTRFWLRSWWIKGPVLAIVAIVALSILGAALPEEDDPAVSTDESPTATNTLAPGETPEPTNTAAPTNTPVPPTTTPAPTATPTPIAISGSGDTATSEVTLGPGLYVATFSHQGSRNFIVYAYGDDTDLLINHIGSYSGSRPLIGDQSYQFEITADGQWSLSIAPVGRTNSMAFSGAGDAVSNAFESSGRATLDITHTGTRNFVIWLHCSSGTDLVVNEIGVYTGSQIVNESGLCVWEVQADGSWSIVKR